MQRLCFFQKVHARVMLLVYFQLASDYRRLFNNFGQIRQKIFNNYFTRTLSKCTESEMCYPFNKAPENLL